MTSIRDVEQRMRRWQAVAATLLTVVPLAAPASLSAQLVRGRVLDALNGTPVSMAGVYLLDRERDHVDVAVADSVGRYFIDVPDAGEYILVAQRFGYYDLESPLLAISDARDYELDLELRPEPVGLGGITVTVQNEQVLDWLRLEFGINPAQAFGFRILQGQRLEEAKARGRFDPTSTLRWLYVPVSHGSCVAIDALPRAVRASGWDGSRGSLFPDPGSVPTGTREPGQSADGEGGSCGRLIVNDRVVPNELLDTIDMRTIAVVVTLPGSVRMYTYDFNWAFRRP